MSIHVACIRITLDGLMPFALFYATCDSPSCLALPCFALDMGLYSNVDPGCVGVIRGRTRTHLPREITRSGAVGIRGLGGFLGERVGGSMKASRFSGNQSIKVLKAEKKVRRVKPGIASAVLTSPNNVTQTLVRSAASFNTY